MKLLKLKRKFILTLSDEEYMKYSAQSALGQVDQFEQWLIKEARNAESEKP